MNDSTSLRAVCFGEILWDVFSDTKAIGGAPLNVALRLNSLGINSSIISKIGDDVDGKNALNYIKIQGLAISNIQIDQENQTGTVTITLDTTGSATYEIKYPAAWDNIELTDEAIAMVKASDAFIFGTLASRDVVSKHTLFKLLEFAKFKVFDVNLRPPHYSYDHLFELMKKADFIKLNDDELIEVCNHMNISASTIKDMLKLLSHKTNTRFICVTEGKNGATLLLNDTCYKSDGYKVNVKDTVGAGDSFLATLIAKLLRKATPEIALNYACITGALVASKKGANPKINLEDIDRIMLQRLKEKK